MRKGFYALTIFIGSCLVFGVQPMVGNTLLPVFGGTAAVWTVCLCAFQLLLLGGYFYAHVMASPSRETNSRTLWGHIALLLLSAAWIGVVGWKFRALVGWTGEVGVPALGALFAVLMLVGVPYTLLSANASLVQALASKGGGNVYKLYAVSNAGSFCGLLIYPLLVEPWLGVSTQWFIFGVGMAVYALCVAVLVKRLGSSMGGGAVVTSEVARQVDHVESSCEGTSVAAVPKYRQWEWLGLSAFSCFLLNGVSAHLCNDVTPLPLLWAVMLALYLLSWVFGFTDRGAKLSPLMALLAFALAVFGAWHVTESAGKGFFIELGVGLALILLGGWTVHARLYRLRPENESLTRYYLFISLGGAIGGTLASLAAPALFNSVVEYPAALVLLLPVAVLEVHAFFNRFGVGRLDWKWVGGGMVVFVIFVHHFGAIANGNVITEVRNFYGTGRVLFQQMQVTGGSDYMTHMFEHAGIQHGMQAVEPFYRNKATMCFGAHAGGLSIVTHPKYTNSVPMRVAVAGMGIATLATYARSNDVYRFYEINPQVASLATNTNLFWYLSDCSAKECKVVVDDARRALEKERARNEEKWDVIIIDVFAGDSIPPHMSTKEAVQLYLDRLAPGGVLSFHLTNWHLGLSPMVKAIAKEFNLHLQGYGCWADKWNIGSYWTFLTREPADFFIKGKHGRVNYDKVKDMPLMTDEKHSLLPYISMNPMPKFE